MMQNTKMKKVKLLAAALLAAIPCLIRAASVTFEAESGVLGSDFTNGISGGVQFISISTDTVNSGNPGNANRVASYTVTFPAAGTYQLYARVLVGPGGFNDDSMFFANSFGVKSPTTDSDWNLVNGLDGAGFNNSTDVVTGGGTLGSEVWKWINLSQYLGQAGFIITAGNLTQTFQIGARENGLDLDKFVFGSANYTFTVADLDAGGPGTPPPPPACAVNWNDTQQHIDGFGFSSAWCGTLTAAKNKALYGTLGMSLLRIRIDETTNWTAEIANSAAAHSYGAKVFGCPWRAPSYMTYNVTNYVTNGVTITTNRFTYLSSNYFNAFALWLNQAANAHNLDYVSVKNEPDLFASSDLNMSPDEIRVFCRSNAPAIGRPVTMADAVGYTDSVSDPTLNDPLAATNVTIVSGHFYGGGNYVHTNALAKGKPVWMTEHYLDGCVTNFTTCLNFAKEINDAMKNQFSAYVAWWAQDGDVNINLANSSGTILQDGYTMGQFSKFIRPGYYRIGTTNSTGSAEISAYKDGASSNFVIVAINRGSTVITQQFTLNGFSPLPMTPWVTSYTQSLEPQSPMTNIGSSFTYLVQPFSIVTLVGSPPVAAPTGLIATAGNSKVDLRWSAVAGVTNYNIKRAGVSGGPYTIVGTASTTSYSDAGLSANTTFYYVVSAIQSGGQSPDSLEVSATTPSVFTIGPSADSYVESGGNAGANFGTSTNLLVKNNVTLSTRNAYLMFDVHALTNLQSATLTLVPNRVDDSTVKMYYELAPTGWTENGITWNNQPGGTGIFFATNTLQVGVPVVLDVTSLAANQATNGGLLSIRITQPTNSLNGLIQFCSKEHPTVSSRPVLTYVIRPNTAPTLAAIADRTIGAGMMLYITNSATDTDVPAQTLTFSLLTAPTNAMIDANSGVLTWRPLVTQANTTNPFSVMVTDNGTPSLTATQSFVVTVNPLARPQISTVNLIAGQLVLQASGDTGPDYQIQTSTNLINWTAVFTNNSPAMPFVWTNSDTSLPAGFFRILTGPPF
jgi:glucuronoarabinoxylan endo-1,4-beta-xylanase